ncbi:hypothetical protein A2U01_0031961, partial [Trifolium medium]|nr:hypothetical protein [Trifolium medium]
DGGGNEEAGEGDGGGGGDEEALQENWTFATVKIALCDG